MKAGLIFTWLDVPALRAKQAARAAGCAVSAGSVSSDRDPAVRGGAGVVRESRPAFGTRPAYDPSVDPVLLELARRLDATAVRLTRGRGAVDLMLGETIGRIFRANLLGKLGCPTQLAFARMIDLPERSMYGYLELAGAVKGLPDLRRAVVRGEVIPSKAKAVAPALRRHPELAEMLLDAARHQSLPAIEKILADLGEEMFGESFVIQTLRLRMPAEVQRLYDEALTLAEKVIGAGRPRWVYEESLAMEFLGEHAGFAPDPEPRRPPPPPQNPRPAAPFEQRRLREQWANDGIEEAIAGLFLAEDDPVFSGLGPETNEPRALMETVRRLLALRQRRDEPLGRILDTIAALRLYEFLEWGNFYVYCRERLGLAERTARQKLWMEGKMREMPELRAALVEGRLGWSKALLVAGDATPSDVEARIAAAAGTSWQQIRRHSTEEEDRQNLAAGIRRIWGPAAVIEVIAAAILAAQRLIFEKEGRKMDAGEALGLIAAGFLRVWKDPVRQKRVSAVRREVIGRTKGICACPECTNPVDHTHHLIPRGAGGPDEAWNLVGLCRSCHARLHLGGIKVEGRAGEKLSWKIRRWYDRWEYWETIGDDDVRLLGEEIDEEARRKRGGVTAA